MMNTGGLLVSVLMGTYYRSEDTTALQRSVTSILEQSYRRIEFLICDDGSSPEAIRYLDHVAAKDSRILLVRPGDAFSLPQKLNRCLREAKGTYIARMDDDDASHPNRLEEQVAYVERNREISFAGCNVALYRNREYAGMWRFPEFPAVQDFFFRQPFVHPTLLFRRTALESVGGYSEDQHCVLCEDYDLLLRLYAAGFQGANLQENLFDYSLPMTAKGGRKMRHRWNEAVTRYRRFRELNVLHAAWPYVVKPILVGLIPGRILQKIKERDR